MATLRTQQYLLSTSFASGQQAGAITPVTMQDFVLSAFSVAATSQTASRAAQLDDTGQCVEMAASAPIVYTVPANASVAFPVGIEIEVCQFGTGQVTITPATGVTIRCASTALATRAQYSTVSLRKRATDEWVLSGDLSFPGVGGAGLGNALIYAGDYGVKSDGITDDTAAWTAALNASVVGLTACGTTVLAPCGTSIVSGIIVPDGVRLVGFYAWTSLPLRQGSTGVLTGSILQSTSVQTIPVVTLSGSSSIVGLSIIGPGSNSQAGIQAASSVGDVMISWCHVSQCGVGIDMSLGGGDIESCWIDGNYSHGILNPKASIIKGCRIANNAGDGIHCGPGSDGNTISGNQISWSGGYNIALQSNLTGGNGPVRNNTVTANQLDAAASANISLVGAFRNTVTANTITRGGRVASGSAPGTVDDANIALTHCAACVIAMNTSAPGLDDGGGGTFGPKVDVYGNGLNATLGGSTITRQVSAVLTSGNQNVTLPNTTGIYPWQINVTGANIPADTWIEAISSTTIVVLSHAPTASGTETITLTEYVGTNGPVASCQLIANDFGIGGVTDTDATLVSTNNITHFDIAG